MQIPGNQNQAIQKKIDEVFEFKSGIPGFENYNQFIVYPYDDHFSFLQCVQNEDLAFIITNPFLFFEDYEFELTEGDLMDLGIQQIEDVAVRSIVTWGDELSKVTANLMAPLIFNARTKHAKQIVLYPTPYKSKHPLLRQQPGQTNGGA